MQLNRKIFITVFTLVILFKSDVVAQHSEYLKPSDSLVRSKIQQWDDWKFGVLIHWGAYAQWGVVESWSLCPEDEDWCKRRGPYADDYYSYKAAYENIRKEFNPVKFNPELWATACKNAGMKYVVFTTKHHDGFCMFDSKYTNYKITDKESAFSSNAKSNVVKEVFNSYRNQGFGIGAYFSKPDWHNENYWWPYFPVYDRNVNYDPVKYPDRWKKFQQFTYNQIEELMVDYGKVDILWLDGGWVRPENSLDEETRPWLGKHLWTQDVDIPKIAAMARTHQPGLIVVDRSVHGAYENYQTPEQQIPEKPLPYPWESCITLGNSWYSTGPNEQYKSTKKVISLLVNIVSKGGNFLLGIGPDKSGDLVPEVYNRLDEIGKWMTSNGEAIYNTKTYYPYQKDKWHFTKSKLTKNVYAIYLPDENETELQSEIIFPLQPQAKSKIYLLGYTKSISWKKEKDGVHLKLNKELINAMKSKPAYTFKCSVASGPTSITPSF